MKLTVTNKEMLNMAFGDNWTLKDFYEELLSIMDSGNFSDVNECLRIETDILNNNLSDEDKKKIIYQSI